MLKIGDQVTTRLVIESDRDMQFIAVQSGWPAGMDPPNPLSGYQWGRVPFYQNYLDYEAQLFFDHLPRGVHVVEFDLWVTHTGRFQAGTTRVESHFAPEFRSYADGKWIRIE